MTDLCRLVSQARIKAKPLLRSAGSFITKETMKPHFDTTVYAPTKYAYTSPVPSIQYITPQVWTTGVWLCYTVAMQMF